MQHHPAQIIARRHSEIVDPVGDYAPPQRRCCIRRCAAKRNASATTVKVGLAWLEVGKAAAPATYMRPQTAKDYVRRPTSGFTPTRILTRALFAVSAAFQSKLPSIEREWNIGRHLSTQQRNGATLLSHSNREHVLRCLAATQSSTEASVLHHLIRFLGLLSRGVRTHSLDSRRRRVSHSFHAKNQGT